MILNEDKSIVKLADFGFATSLEGPKGNGVLYDKIGSKNFLAPELHIEENPYRG